MRKLTCTKVDHNRLRELPEKEWNALERRKDWDFEDGEILEQRDCPRCGSTLARPKKGTAV
jgi:hypothetical protein